jgi:predicted metal-dependent phosphoesterase TrpH
VAVLAHPATLHLSGKVLQDQIRQLAEQGLGGIELYYAEYRPETQQIIQNLATELDLVCTGGTDFHGANSPDLKLGIGLVQLHVPDEALDQLKAKAVSPCTVS